MTAATAAQAAEAEHQRTSQAATAAHLTHVGFADVIADLEARYVDGDPSVSITSIEKAKRDAERARLESARAAAENDKAAQRAAETHAALAEEQRAALEARITDPDDELNRLLAELPALVTRARDLIDERHAACVALRAAPAPVGPSEVFAWAESAGHSPAEISIPGVGTERPSRRLAAAIMAGLKA